MTSLALSHPYSAEEYARLSELETQISEGVTALPSSSVLAHRLNPKTKYEAHLALQMEKLRLLDLFQQAILQLQYPRHELRSRFQEPSPRWATMDVEYFSQDALSWFWDVLGRKYDTVICSSYDTRGSARYPQPLPLHIRQILIRSG